MVFWQDVAHGILMVPSVEVSHMYDRLCSNMDDLLGQEFQLVPAVQEVNDQVDVLDIGEYGRLLSSSGMVSK